VREPPLPVPPLERRCRITTKAIEAAARAAMAIKIGTRGDEPPPLSVLAVEEPPAGCAGEACAVVEPLWGLPWPVCGLPWPPLPPPLSVPDAPAPV
jgi:hypothetical protein